jgi:3'-phosphoadenosine 5'-phosphosulfate sulfotransferase (PAPS reductase)/FAD synthetase
MHRTLGCLPNTSAYSTQPWNREAPTSTATSALEKPTRCGRRRNKVKGYGVSDELSNEKFAPRPLSVAPTNAAISNA